MNNQKINKKVNLDIEEIINQYSGYIYKTVLNISKDNLSEEDIEEIIADTFFSFWKNKEKFDRTKEIKFYLCGIAKNLIKQKFRKNEVNYDIDNYENVLPDTVTINDIYERNEKQRIIERELNKLSKQDIAIFIMFYYNSKKIKEISTELETSEFIVKSRLYRIRKKLKKELERQGYSYEK